jgi:hypothetical protein
MSNELESDRATVMNLEGFGVDGAGYDETETEPPSSTNTHGSRLRGEILRVRCVSRRGLPRPRPFAGGPDRCGIRAPGLGPHLFFFNPAPGY